MIDSTGLGKKPKIIQDKTQIRNLLTFLKKTNWSKQGCYDYYFLKNGSVGLTFPTRDLNLVSGQLPS